MSDSPPERIEEALAWADKFEADTTTKRGIMEGHLIVLAAALREARAENERLREALARTRSIAVNGPGPGTTPEQALQTIAEYVNRRLAALAVSPPADKAQR